MICLSIKLPFNMCHFCLQAYAGIHEIGKSSATSQARKVGQLFIHPNYTTRQHVNFTNILRAAFAHADPKSIKNTISV